MEEYSQLVIWLGVYVGEENIEEFEKFFKEKYDFRVKYHSEFELLNEYNTSCTLFYIHSEDIAKFSIFRLCSGDMKWFEDYVENNPSEISEEILELYYEYMKLEFGYNKSTKELVIFKNGDDVVHIKKELDDDEIETLKCQLENEDTYLWNL